MIDKTKAQVHWPFSWASACVQLTRASPPGQINGLKQTVMAALRVANKISTWTKETTALQFASHQGTDLGRQGRQEEKEGVL